MHRIPATSTWLLSMMVVVMGLTPDLRAGTHPPARNGFMIGFGIGGASLGIEDGDERETSVVGNFRIGYAVRQDLVLHLESNAWTRTFEETLGDVTWTFSSSTAALTYYPPEIGLFLRGGIGIGYVNVELDTQGVTISDDEGGFAFLLAGGYEWRLSKKFALAPQVEYTYMDLDTLGSANMVGGSLGFNWYW